MAANFLRILHENILSRKVPPCWPLQFGWVKIYRGFKKDSASAHWGKGRERGGESGSLTPFVASEVERKFFSFCQKTVAETWMKYEGLRWDSWLLARWDLSPCWWKGSLRSSRPSPSTNMFWYSSDPCISPPEHQRNAGQCAGIWVSLLPVPAPGNIFRTCTSGCLTWRVQAHEVVGG